MSGRRLFTALDVGFVGWEVKLAMQGLHQGRWSDARSLQQVSPQL
ncbi:hypothetical protein [Prevotella denticola]|nr:hypothetical protein [Prevotella denticola]